MMPLLLKEDIKIEACIKKLIHHDGCFQAFFDKKYVNKSVKLQIYIAGPLNALLWGCELWNLTKQTTEQTQGFPPHPHQKNIRNQVEPS